MSECVLLFRYHYKHIDCNEELSVCFSDGWKLVCDLGPPNADYRIYHVRKKIWCAPIRWLLGRMEIPHLEPAPDPYAIKTL